MLSNGEEVVRGASLSSIDRIERNMRDTGVMTLSVELTARMAYIA